MGKYEPLTQYLKGRDTTEVPMTFEQIEAIIGTHLPLSKQYAAWWSNNPSNNVMTKAWLAAGFQTERVDPGSERLVFRRRRSNSATVMTEPLREIDSPPMGKGRSFGFLDRIRSEMAGTVTIPEGVDITEPTGEIWDAEH